MRFISKILRDIKRAIIILLVIAVVSSIIYTVNKYGSKSKKIKYSAIIDTDSGNSIDDLFAVARVLADPQFEVIGLTSAQWNFNPHNIQETVAISQKNNTNLLKYFGKENIPHLL